MTSGQAKRQVRNTEKAVPGPGRCLLAPVVLRPSELTEGESGRVWNSGLEESYITEADLNRPCSQGAGTPEPREMWAVEAQPIRLQRRARIPSGTGQEAICMAASCQQPKNPTETELKGNGLACLCHCI